MSVATCFWSWNGRVWHATCYSYEYLQRCIWATAAEWNLTESFIADTRRGTRTCHPHYTRFPCEGRWQGFLSLLFIVPKEVIYRCPLSCNLSCRIWSNINRNSLEVEILQWFDIALSSQNFGFARMMTNMYSMEITLLAQTYSESW